MTKTHANCDAFSLRCLRTVTVRKNIVTRMDKGPLRCLRKTTHNPHVCGRVHVCAHESIVNTVNTVTNQYPCGFVGYGMHKSS